MKRWLESYQSLMVRTRIVSLVPTFLICCVALFEFIRILLYISTQVQMDSELAYMWGKDTLLKILIIGGFGFRFLVIRRRKDSSETLISLSWLTAFSTALLYWLDYSFSFGVLSDNPFTIYSFRNVDPLNGIWIWFGFFSLLRFLITGGLAFLAPNEFNSNS